MMEYSKSVTAANSISGKKTTSNMQLKVRWVYKTLQHNPNRFDKAYKCVGRICLFSLENTIDLKVY